MSHSKRNTSRPVFTSHERNLAKSAWSSSSARLNRESFLPFGSCGLCLEIAREPVSCQRGDIFCRECALANILAQKKELKRAEKCRQDAEREAALGNEEREEEDRVRAVQDFEMTQAGLLDAPNSNKSHSQSQSAEAQPPRIMIEPSKPPDGTNTATELVLVSNSNSTGMKRKFELDENELERTARADKIRARKAIDDEKANKKTLPSFWSPSLTPDVRDTNIGPAKGKNKAHPTCPASKSDHPHPFTLHKLITIEFSEEVDPTTQEKRRSCPSCRKVLSNASAAVMAKGCGHVLCQKCVQQFLIPSDKKKTKDANGGGDLATEGAIINCFVCDKPVAVDSVDEGSKHRLPVGLVSLRSEGTGFSAKGTSTVEKSITSFQC